MRKWTYGVEIREEESDFVVFVRDLPEVVSSSDSLEEALDLAADAVEAIVASRMERDQPLAPPSSVGRDEHPVTLPAPLAAKASVYSAWKAANMTKVELARRLIRNEAEVRRILNPRHGTKLDQLEEAARVLGGHLQIAFEPISSDRRV